MPTVNSILNVALTKTVDVSKVRMPDVCAVLRDQYGVDPYHGTFVKPETEALDFYLANHVVGLIRTKKGETKPLTNSEAELLTKYTERSNEMALRAFAYLLLICSREMRHMKNTNIMGMDLEQTEIKCGQFIHEHVKNGGGQNIANQIWNGAWNWPVGVWVTVLEKFFRNGSWNGGYGGKKWADVTLCMVEYVRGVYTAEMMVDVVWTLCHNGGPIFNKGMLYHTHGSELLRVLDVQRAGQVPQFEWGALAGDWYSDFLDTARSVFPELGDEADIELIKQTAVHTALWGGNKYKTAGVKTIKEAVQGQGGVVVKTVKVDRDD